MKYSTPELVVLGSADALVLGQEGAEGDNPNPLTEQIVAGVVPGLDD